MQTLTQYTVTIDRDDVPSRRIVVTPEQNLIMTQPEGFDDFAIEAIIPCDMSNENEFVMVLDMLTQVLQAVVQMGNRERNYTEPATRRDVAINRTANMLAHIIGHVADMLYEWDKCDHRIYLTELPVTRP